jgi:hypothetical protein
MWHPSFRDCLPALALALCLACHEGGAPRDDKGDTALTDPDEDGDGFPASVDCDDEDASVWPGAEETCADGIDQDCDGRDPPESFSYPDGDGDGWGDSERGERACGTPEGFVERGGDCDDTRPDLHPGQEEPCGAPNGLDEDCDGLIDECSLKRSALLLSGSREGDDAGQAVASGDLDGDGRLDLIVGAPRADASASDSGEVYVVYAPLDADRALADADARVRGAGFDDHAGWAMAGGRDLTGDGLPDLLIGAIWENSLATGGGAVYLVEGPILGLLGLDEARFVGVGSERGAFAGNALAIVGDTNGDALPEILAGRLSSSLGAELGGGAVLLHSPFTGTRDLGAGEALLLGDIARAQAGSSLASAGDLDGDGFDDILVGAPEELLVSRDGHGRVYVLLGPLLGSLPLSAADAQLLGEDDAWCAGISLDGGRDFDGDGYMDVLVGGACGYTAVEGDAGRSWLVRGPIAGLQGLAEADLVVSGAVAAARAGHDAWRLGDGAGRSVAFGGDIDGDGAEDLLIGASRASLPEEEGGAVFVVNGPMSGRVSLSFCPFWTGAGPDARLGIAVARLGDSDGDGRDEALLGAHGANGTGVVWLAGMP